MGGNPSEDVRGWFAGLIEGWDPAFAAGSQAERERGLLAWCDSADVMQRAAFQALRKLTSAFLLLAPLAGRGPEPGRRGARLPRPARGPPGRAAEDDHAAGDHRRHRARVRRRRRRLGRRRRHRRRGAGRGRPRRRRRRGGRVLQRGGLRRSRARRATRGSTSAAAASPPPTRASGLLAGSCLGGGTTVNYTWCFRPPDHVRATGRSASASTTGPGQDFDASLDAVWERIHVNAENSIPSRARPRDSRRASTSSAGTPR